jgi:predicted nuclease of restriction endonuclease-like RecB superfamily
LLPRNLLSYRIRDGNVVPLYLTHRDEVWVRLVLEELDALVGRTRGDADRILEEKARRLAADHGVAPTAVAAVRHLLEKLWRTRVAAAAPPAEIRRVVYELAADVSVRRDEILGRAASTLGIRSEEVTGGLFADRPSERRIVAPDREPSTREIVERHNLALVQGLLLRSEHMVAHVRAHANSVVRFAKLHGLLCTYAMDPDGTEITLSGPLALFRHTLKYGLALATFFPALVVTPGWSLHATCHLGTGSVRLQADASHPIAATHSLPRDTDSLVEKRLVQDFRRLGSRWSIRRETAALQAGRRAFFPDFTLEAEGARVYVEIVGFYTPEYLESKLRALREARLANVVVCIDESLACADEDIRADEIVRFRRRVEADRLLEAAERVASRDIRGERS